MCKPKCLSKWLKSAVFIALLTICAPQDSFAVLNLRANPGDIRFNPGDLSQGRQKEVTLKITSTDGKQYEVQQRLIKPFTNARGDQLASDALKTYTLAGSNSSGTLYQQSLDNLSYSDQELYTSGSLGESDSFTVAYIANADELKRGVGEFFGQIYYTINAVGGSSTSNVILNVYLEASGKLEVSIEGSVVSDRIRLNIDTEDILQEYIKVDLSGNPGQSLKVYGELDKPLVTELFEPLDSETLLFKVRADTTGIIHQPEETPLTEKQTLLFETDEVENTFFIHFTFDEEKFGLNPAGQYSGRLKYTLSADGLNQEFFIDIDVEIEPVFNLDIQYPSGGMKFNPILPDAPPQVLEVIVSVKSNLGRAYMVTQKLPSGSLVNESGAKIDPEFFMFKQELVQGNGKVENDEYTSVVGDDSPVFFSDKKGTPAQFKVYYRLRAYPKIEAGSYSTAIRFSLGEI